MKFKTMNKEAQNTLTSFMATNFYRRKKHQQEKWYYYLHFTPEPESMKPKEKYIFWHIIFPTSKVYLSVFMHTNMMITKLFSELDYESHSWIDVIELNAQCMKKRSLQLLSITKLTEFIGLQWWSALNLQVRQPKITHRSGEPLQLTYL